MRIGQGVYCNFQKDPQNGRQIKIGGQKSLQNAQTFVPITLIQSFMEIDQSV